MTTTGDQPGPNDLTPAETAQYATHPLRQDPEENEARQRAQETQGAEQNEAQQRSQELPEELENPEFSDDQDDDDAESNRS